MKKGWYSPIGVTPAQKTSQELQTELSRVFCLVRRRRAHPHLHLEKEAFWRQIASKMLVAIEFQERQRQESTGNSEFFWPNS